eukprot:scaffold413609_cov20-Prasinocladus_malaysianus.AAC.1
MKIGKPLKRLALELTEAASGRASSKQLGMMLKRAYSVDTTWSGPQPTGDSSRPSVTRERVASRQNGCVPISDLLRRHLSFQFYLVDDVVRTSTNYEHAARIMQTPSRGVRTRTARPGPARPCVRYPYVPVPVNCASKRPQAVIWSS